MCLQIQHLLRTKAVPSSLHACIGLASSSLNVRSGYASVSRSTCGRHVGLPYPVHTTFGTLVPA